MDESKNKNFGVNPVVVPPLYFFFFSSFFLNRFFIMSRFSKLIPLLSCILFAVALVQAQVDNPAEEVSFFIKQR